MTKVTLPGTLPMPVYITLGSSQEVDVQVESPFVEPHHANVAFTGRQFIIEPIQDHVLVVDGTELTKADGKSSTKLITHVSQVQLGGHTLSKGEFGEIVNIAYAKAAKVHEKLANAGTSATVSTPTPSRTPSDFPAA